MEMVSGGEGVEEEFEDKGLAGRIGGSDVAEVESRVSAFSG
jgi:hypothetical protein